MNPYSRPILVVPPLYEGEADDHRQLRDHGWVDDCDACERARDRIISAMRLPRRVRVDRLDQNPELRVQQDLLIRHFRAAIANLPPSRPPRSWRETRAAIQAAIAGLRAKGSDDERS